MAADFSSLEHDPSLAPLVDPPRNAVVALLTNAPPLAPNGAAPVHQVGRYEILQEIARGGMGVVYKARHLDLKRVVALKMILSGGLVSESTMRRFRTEAEAAANLDHPNIVPLYEVGEHDGNPYFTMKLIEGEAEGDLARWLDHWRLPVKVLPARLQKDMARLLATVARAVHHAHQRGILHRDLKPSNILLQRVPGQSRSDLASATPMVADFGLAKRVTPGGEVSQSLTIVGTASYMSPEQALTTGPALTVATDVYSLGAVLYEMLTGRPPFRGENYMGTLIQVVQDPPVPPRQWMPSADADLERICLKCLEKAPEDRYASADALADELEHWAAGDPISVRPQGWRERLWRLCRRNPVVAALGGTVAFLVLGVAVFSTVVNIRLSAAAEELKDARDAAESHARKAQASADKAAWNAEQEAEARNGADRALVNALLALGREESARNEERIQRDKSRQLLARQYVSNGAGLLDGGDPLGALAWFGEALNLDRGDAERELPHRVRLAAALRRCPHLLRVVFHAKGIPVFCLSGDGRRLLAAERNGPVRLWDTTADKSFVLRQADASPIVQALFSPDSRYVAAGDEDGVVRMWNTGAGENAGQSMRHGAAISHLEFSRDCRHLLTASRDGTARVWDTNTGKSLSAPLKHGAAVTFASFSPDGKSVLTAGAAAAGTGGEAMLWDWSTAKQVGKTIKLKAPVVDAIFSTDGHRLYTTGSNHNLRGWDVTTAKSVTLPLPSLTGTSGVWFSPDAQRVLVGQGNAAHVYDLTTGQPLGHALTHGAGVVLAAFGHDGRQVVTAGWDRVVRVWETSTGQPVTPPLLHPRRVLGVGFDSSGQRLVTGCEDGTVRLWDIRSRDEAAPPLQVKSAGEMLAVGPGGRWVLGSSKGVPRVWDVAAGSAVTPPLIASKPAQAAFSPDGRRFVILDADSLRVWDVAAKQEAGRVLGPSAKIQQISFSPDGSSVAARLGGDQVRTWNAATGREIASGKVPGNAPWEVPVVSPNGQWVVTLKSKQVVQVWDLVAGKEAAPSIKQIANVIHAAFGPDGSRLATACADGTVRVWDAKTGEPVTPALAHGQFLQMVGFSLSANFLGSAGSDGTARVWDVRTGQPLTPLLHQGEAIAGVSFAPEGDRLATISKAGTVRIWDLRPDSRPVPDLQVLIKLLSGQKMHAASGSFVPFDAVDLGQSWPQLRARFPSEFGPR